jgi:hypothetical protein
LSTVVLSSKRSPVCERRVVTDELRRDRLEAALVSER